MNTAHQLAILLAAHEMGDDYGADEATVRAIVEDLGFDEALVREVLEGETGEDHDGQPDEAQEWYDFDCDC
jgi:hypothetical protein